MDQVKVGRFIAASRKEKELTQRQLADMLLISDKTVSKWETGKGLPEVSLMLPLCKILEITVNELLTGERLNESDYKKYAEENIMKLMNEKQESKKKIILATVVCLIMLLSAITLILVAGMLEMQEWLRAVLIAIGFVVIVLGTGVCCVLENGAGAFECRHCGHRFVPAMKEYVMAPHTVTTRRLTCPECGKKSYCKKRLTLKKD